MGHSKVMCQFTINLNRFAFRMAFAAILNVFCTHCLLIMPLNGRDFAVSIQVLCGDLIPSYFVEEIIDFTLQCAGKPA